MNDSPWRDSYYLDHLTPQAILTWRGELLRSARFLALASIGSALLQLGVLAVTFGRTVETLVWAVPVSITAAATFLWFYLWWWRIIRYKDLTATLMNHEDLRSSSLGEQPLPYWVDSRIFYYIGAVYLQIVVVVGLAGYFDFGERLGEGALKFVGLLVWPGALLLSAAIIGRSLKWGRRRDEDTEDRGAQDLKNQILSLEVRADQAKLPEANRHDETADIPITSKAFQDLARLSPPATVFLAWGEVDAALRRAAQRSGIDHRKLIRVITKGLKEKNLISEEIQTIITELRDVRNQVVSSTRRKLMAIDAEEYIRLSRRVIAQLEQVPSGVGSTKTDRADSRSPGKME